VAILPLAGAGINVDDELMAATVPVRAVGFAADPSAGGAPDITICTLTLRQRLALRLGGERLDRRIASGVAIDAQWALVARARRLLQPSFRARLAGHWLELLNSAERPVRFADPRVPVRRAAVRAAAEDIRKLVGRLQAAGPLAACGVASAAVLLTDSQGPLYDHRSCRTLGEALREALDALDPYVELAG
jgi:hypothetical protein